MKLGEALNKARKFFNNEERFELWMLTKNPFLGNVSPVWMILCGRSHKLVQFIDNALDKDKQYYP